MMPGPIVINFLQIDEQINRIGQTHRTGKHSQWLRGLGPALAVVPGFQTQLCLGGPGG